MCRREARGGCGDEVEGRVWKIQGRVKEAQGDQELPLRIPVQAIPHRAVPKRTRNLPGRAFWFLVLRVKYGSCVLAAYF